MNTYWRKIFGWSKTRQNLWDECRLAYYYHYIGKWEGLPGEPEREKLQKLSKLKKFVFWKGELIHEVVRNQVERQKQNQLFLQEGARGYFLQQIEMAKQSPMSFVTEAFNGFPVDNERFAGAAADGLQQIETFFQNIWPRYENRTLLECEKLNSFEIDRTKVWVQVDLITRTDDERTVITDWKTGDEKWIDESTDEQMGVYMLWAISRFHLPLSSVSAELVFLRSGESKSVLRSEAQLQELERAIVLRAGQMLAVQSEQDFSPNPVERKCRECNFATICPEGRQRVFG